MFSSSITGAAATPDPSSKIVSAPRGPSSISNLQVFILWASTSAASSQERWMSLSDRDVHLQVHPLNRRVAAVPTERETHQDEEEKHGWNRPHHRGSGLHRVAPGGRPARPRLPRSRA